MAKVFLSHSSKDKDSYVRIVAEKLIKEIGEDKVIFDETTFEEGMMTLQEINERLEITDLFVIFISEFSLCSKWVQHELGKAKELWSEEKLTLIYPIIIDKKINFNDTRIPEWMVKDYIIKPIMRPNKSYMLIRQRLLEISWKKHPRLHERSNIFVGRNLYLQEFEERMDDLEKSTPVAIIISGLRGIGRRTLAKKCLKKSNVVKESYSPSIISLKYDESIEDFLLKLYDLGLTDEITITNLMHTPLENKTKTLIHMTKQLQAQKEIVFIEDEGGIINQEGSIVKWFIDVLDSAETKGKICYCIISKFRYSKRNYGYKEENVFSMELSELNKAERTGLLKRCVEFEQIEMSNNNMNNISNLLMGFPDQIFYAISIVREKGVSYLEKNLNLITDYNNQKASILIAEFESFSEKMQFLRLLIEFDYIGLDFIFEIVGNNSGYEIFIEELISKAICEYVGVNREYIRVNEIIKDYLMRTEYKISEEHQKMLSSKLNEFVDSIDINHYDIPQFLYSLKEAIADNKKVDDKYIVPSLYLKNMTELYNQGKNKDVVQFADKVLENKDFMDDRIIFEIRYLLCSSLAKMRSKRFLDEVQNITGADHSFLFGFYYRQIGRYDKALERLNEALDKRRNYQKAKREIVQVYISLQEFGIAKELAEENYKNYTDNPYHIQAYFTCLIKGEKSRENKEILQNLMDSLEKITSDTAKEMLLRCQAQFAAFYEDDCNKAIKLINEAIDYNPNIHYALLSKFDICERFNKLEEMKKIVEFLNQPDLKNRYYNNIICFESIIMAKAGNVIDAIDYFYKNMKSYTDQAMERFKQKLLKYYIS